MLVLCATSSTAVSFRPCIGHNLLDAGVLRNIDNSGVSVAEALEQAGFDPSPASLRKMAIPRDKASPLPCTAPPEAFKLLAQMLAACF